MFLEHCLASRPWPEHLLDPLIAEPGNRALFRIVVERLGDLFEPRLCSVYADLFAGVILPVPDPAGTPAPTAPDRTPPPARILVVDDQPANIQVVGSVLGKLGYEIIPALDGLTALKRAAMHPPDLILLDLLMPGMDGCEVCRRLREDHGAQDVPVIFVSAADGKDLVVQALEAGGVDYITKPFNHAELVLRVKTQLELKSARDRLEQLAEDKDELLGMLAHDLKNHLGGMQMSSQLLH